MVRASHQRHRQLPRFRHGGWGTGAAISSSCSCFGAAVVTLLVWGIGLAFLNIWIGIRYDHPQIPLQDAFHWQSDLLQHPRERLNSVHGSVSVSLQQRQQQQEQQQQQQQQQQLPPLDSLVHGWNITGNVTWLLDFSIAGFPKTGTSTIMFHLHRTHPEVTMFDDERCELSYNQQIRLIYDLYQQQAAATATADEDVSDQPNAAAASAMAGITSIDQQQSNKQSQQLPHVRKMMYGIKCPIDLENTNLAMRNYQRYFPTTNLIIGLRHPVLWMESLYNFRLQNRNVFHHMPPLEYLVGKCRRGFNNVCTFRSNFHLFLANLGLVPLSNRSNYNNSNTLQLPDNNNDNHDDLLYFSREAMHALDVFGTPTDPRRVFVYEISQLDEKQAPDRAAQLRLDLQHFLQLSQPITPWKAFKPGQPSENGSEFDTTNNTNNSTSTKVNICDSRYDTIRGILQAQAINASRWIRTFFVNAPNVVVSNKHEFVHDILPAWERDPCLDRNGFHRA